MPTQHTADPLGSTISPLLAFPTMPTPSAFTQHITLAFYLYPFNDPFALKYTKDERLSGESLEYEPFELKSDNIVVSRSHPLPTSYTAPTPN